MRRLGLALLAASMAAGCVPQMEPDVPELTGLVTRSGAPVQGATILAADRWEPRLPCRYTRPVAETDHLGRFHYKGKRRLHLAVLAGDPRPHWEMCVRLGETVWFGMRPGGRGLQGSMDVGKCDIARDPPQDPWGEGICGP